MTRKYDIVLLGATGFTGQLTAQYLSLHAVREGIQWAVAGRSREKLDRLVTTCKGSLPEVLIADVRKDDTLAAMAQSATVVMNAAGPFNLYGRNVVDHCVRAGTHYLDITGEPSFVADVYQTYSDPARLNHVCIVNCCGFDSIPADVAAWMTARKLQVHEPKKLQGFIRTNATFSGGTLTTALHALHMEARGTSVKVKLPTHPDAPKKRMKIHFQRRLKAWAIPMPVVDPHIVKRSAYFLPQHFGEAVTYEQYFLRSSLWKVVKTVFPILMAMFLVRFRFFRDRMFAKYAPGTGPDAARRKESRFEVVCLGTSMSSEAISIVAGGDPGYDETAKMFSQSAFTLLELHKNGLLQHGVLTPVQALGDVLVDRLRNEGIRID